MTRMTRNEAKKALESWRDIAKYDGERSWSMKEVNPELAEALDIAIEALQAPELTADEIRMLRKVLQAANLLYTVIEKTVTTNKADELLQKLRRIETEDTEQ